MTGVVLGAVILPLSYNNYMARFGGYSGDVTPQQVCVCVVGRGGEYSGGVTSQQLCVYVCVWVLGDVTVWGGGKRGSHHSM